MMFTKFFTAVGFLATTFFAPVASQKACKSTLDIVVSSSGAPGAGFDNDKKDFDILRELVVLAGLADQLGPNGLKDITVFAPWDEGEKNDLLLLLMIVVYILSKNSIVQNFSSITYLFVPFFLEYTIKSSSNCSIFPTGEGLE